jgi:hypothetical protein
MTINNHFKGKFAKGLASLLVTGSFIFTPLMPAVSGAYAAEKPEPNSSSNELNQAVKDKLKKIDDYLSNFEYKEAFDCSYSVLGNKFPDDRVLCYHFNDGRDTIFILDYPGNGLGPDELTVKENPKNAGFSLDIAPLPYPHQNLFDKYRGQIEKDAGKILKGPRQTKKLSL